MREEHGEEFRKKLRQPVAKNRTLGVGIIGFGTIGRVHRLAIESCEGAKVVAVSRRTATSDPDLDLTCYEDYTQLLRRDDVDVVAICSPSGVHAAQARAALLSGKHVVVEKPIALDVVEATELVALARDKNLMLASIVQRRFEPQNLAIRKLIIEGSLGRPVLGEALVRWHRSQEYYDAAGWRGTLSDDGGVLLNQALHTIDLLCWFLGPAAESFGLTATLTHDIEAEDTAASVIRFASGALGVISATTSAYPGTTETLSLFFDRGHCMLSGREIVAWTFDGVPQSRDQERSVASGAADPAAIGASGHRAQWEDIVSSLRAGSETAVTGADALDSLNVIMQARAPLTRS